MAWIKLNATTPAAPEGARNAHFRQEAGHEGTQSDPVPTSVFLDARAAAGITIGGGGDLPATGSKGFLQIPFAATIKSWTMLADAAGSSAQITVKKSTYSGFPTTTSIVAAAPPILTTAQKNTSSTLTGWTTAIAAGDVLEFVLDSRSVLTRLHLTLELVRT